MPFLTPQHLYSQGVLQKISLIGLTALLITAINYYLLINWSGVGLKTYFCFLRSKETLIIKAKSYSGLCIIVILPRIKSFHSLKKLIVLKLL